MSATTSEPPAPSAAPPQAATATAPAPAPAPAPPPPADDLNLFDGASDTPPSATPAAPGTRPDHIPEQFWDPATNQPRIEAMLKSWKDLRQKVSQGTGAAPETPDAYAFPTVEGLNEEIVKADDPLWQQLRQSAHKAGVSQAQLAAILTPIIQDQIERAKQTPGASPEADQAARQAALAEQKQLLGPNADLMISDMKAWIKGMQTRGSLTEGEAQALLQAGNANGIRALAKLRALTGEKAIPLDTLAGADMTKEDAHKLMTAGYAKKNAGQPGGDEEIERGRRALKELERRGLL
jgi:hypothetical protein